MDIQALRGSYKRAIEATGHRVDIDRQAGGAATKVRCRIAGYQPQEIAGTIMQGDQRVILLAEDLARFPVPPRKGDRVITSDGRALTVIHCDGNTRKIGDTVIAYEIQARGA